jgi:dTDP-4-amino-4,6-dideoxygalactose transaminase
MENEVEGPWYYEQVSLGYNYRLTDIQAALGSSQLTRLSAQHARRDALAMRYDGMLANVPLKLPARLDDRQSAHHLYVVEIDASQTSVSRKSVYEHLRNNGIGANVHYIPIHLHPDYCRLGFKKGDFPVSERYYEQAITLPLYPALTESQQNYIVATLASAIAT